MGVETDFDRAATTDSDGPRRDGSRDRFVSLARSFALMPPCTDIDGAYEISESRCAGKVQLGRETRL